MLRSWWRWSWLAVAIAAACSSFAAGLPPERVGELPWGEAAADRVALTARDLIERGEPKAALRELEAVLAEQPFHVDARRLRQDVLRERGRRGRLLHEAEQELLRAPDDAIAHYLFGRIVPDRGAKFAAFGRAAELAPASLWPWLGLAHTLRAVDAERALAVYERLHEASGRHPLVAVAYAATLRETQQLDAAAAVYQQLRGQPQVLGVSELGQAQIALARDDRAAAWTASLEALRLRPFDAGVQSLVLGWLESGLRDDQVGQLLDLLREHPPRLAAFGAGGGAPALWMLLQRSGQAQALRSLLEARGVDARQPALRRAQRRLLLSLGDTAAFLAIVRSDVPQALVDAEPNRVRGRWLQLLRGPWHAGDPMPDSAAAAALLVALRDVGWLAEVELLAEVALRRFPAAAELLALRDEARLELAFEAGLRRLVYQGYQRRDTADLTVVTARIRDLSQRLFGRDVVGQPEVFRAPLVGEMLDPFTGELAAHLDRYNKHLVLGRRAGGTAEGLLLTRLSVAELPDQAELSLPTRCFEVVGFDRDVTSLGGVLGGDLAGVALLNHFLIDFDAVREWARGIADRRRIAAEDGGVLATDPLPAGAGSDPLDVSWRLSLLSPVQDNELDAAVLDTIRHHERQHLVDAFYYLPVEHNLWRSLGLVLSFGFSPAAVEAEMERRAELASLAVSPHTELVLAHIADFLVQPVPSSPHHQGFGELAVQLQAALVAQGLPAADVVPSRWHLAPRQLVQRAARELLGELP
ncbi:MAG: hypothetical protein MUC36_15715 [Planctomycetes bacterium]|jgi:hypothetical protein|nr:hypothetical protein [Planctomycetota bacterium]